MAGTDPQSLLAAGNCFTCYGNAPGTWAMLKLALLKAWLLTLNPVAATDPQSLLNSANCYVCYANAPGMQAMLELALLKQILAAISPTTPTDPQSLLTAANCFVCYGNSPGVRSVMELALLAQISSGGTVTLGPNLVAPGNYVSGIWLAFSQVTPAFYLVTPGASEIAAGTFTVTIGSDSFSMPAGNGPFLVYSKNTNTAVNLSTVGGSFAPVTAKIQAITAA